MLQPPEYSNTLSIKLSEVLEDIGMNEEMVMKRRKVFMLMESLESITSRSFDEEVTIYLLGSQSEGTTTQGLRSDIDILYVNHNCKVIQDWSEWKQNTTNYLMVRNENVTPGYCFLQLLRTDEPLPETIIPDEYYIKDGSGRILLKNVWWTTRFLEEAERQGPSDAFPGNKGYVDKDFVFAMPCKSLPQSVLHFLERHHVGKWPSDEMLRYSASNDCFVVGASSKISTNPELEWRISTNLAEKCFMFNLNMIQIQCYILMKMILKTILNPRKENGLSSYMFKTILLRCIENTEQSIWNKSNLTTCLTYCLLELHKSVQSDSCPHFFISENNLMAGQFTVEMKHELLRNISDVIHHNGSYLLRINIDDMGHRLQTKLNTLPYLVLGFSSPREIHVKCSSMLYFSLASEISRCHICILRFLRNDDIRQSHLMQSIFNLTYYMISGNRPEQLASRFIVMFLYSTLGSIRMSSRIGQSIPMSPQAMKYLFLGQNIDVTSSRLKLASVFYCTSDLYRAEFILRQTERLYHPDAVVHVCGCWSHLVTFPSSKFMQKCSETNEDCINCITSFCVKFQRTEIHCVPRELQYELMRSTRGDTPYRSQNERDWMDFAVIDSLPYLYFLQYKTYGHLDRYEDQQHALNNLVVTTITDANFGHRETSFNLLGQCMEQEGKPRAALQCYMFSLQQRARNNAAKIHICMLLSKIAFC